MATSSHEAIKKLMLLPEDKIYFGFAPNHRNHYDPEKIQPTLVFFGSPKSFPLFAQWLEKLLIENKEGDSISFRNIDLFVKGKFDIVLQLLPIATGMRHLSDNILEWGLSKEKLELFAGKLNNFSGGPTYGTYWDFLDCDAIDEVEVVVQVGEDEFRMSEFV